MNLFFSVWLQFFFLLTPFFVLSMFLALTPELSSAEKRRLALQVTTAVVITCLTLFFLGNTLFKVFGITLDAFRIGAGGLLFLSAVDLIRGKPTTPADKPGSGIAVVPLAIPITVGPATTGALLVMGAEMVSPLQRLIGSAALMAAGLTLGLLLLLSAAIERFIGQTGLIILSKLTGLILSALAAQIVFTGIQNFMGLN
jgi:multiple antibiotic resistance protein